MASINQIVSQVSNKLGKPLNIALKQSTKLLIIQLYNQEVRRNYTAHGYKDQIFKQSFKLVSDSFLVDGEMGEEESFNYRRSKEKIPNPIRVVNNIPLDSVRTVGIPSIVLPFIQTDRIQYYIRSKTMKNIPSYSIIDGYLFIYNTDEDIIIEGVFANPTEIPDNVYNENSVYFDDNEFLIPEDLVPAILNQIYNTYHLGNTNENYKLNGSED